MRYGGFIGPTYTTRSIKGSIDRSINLYPERNEAAAGKWNLVGTPGLKRLLTFDAEAAVRGIFAPQDRIFAVCGERLYEVFTGPIDYTVQTASWTFGQIGVVENAITPAQFAWNGTQYFIVSGTSGYVLVGNTLTKVTPQAGLPAISQVQFLDQLFVGLEPNTRKIHISSILDGMTWAPLDVGVKESNPDNVVAILADHGELWVLGDRTAEVWWNSGNPDFPFERIPNARLELGCGAPGSVAKLDNSVFWIGNDERGNRVVWRATGYTAQRISNHSVEHHLNRFDKIGDIVAFTYQEEGHSFYSFHSPSMPPNNEISWVYDAAVNMWHERGWWDKIHGRFEPHRARCHAFTHDIHVVGDRNNGKLYQQKLDLYDDSGDRIRRIRIAPHLNSEMRWNFYNSFTLDLEIAVGLGVIDTAQYGKDQYGKDFVQ